MKSTTKITIIISTTIIFSLLTSSIIVLVTNNKNKMQYGTFIRDEHISLDSGQTANISVVTYTILDNYFTEILLNVEGNKAKLNYNGHIKYDWFEDTYRFSITELINTNKRLIDQFILMSDTSLSNMFALTPQSRRDPEINIMKLKLLQANLMSDDICYLLKPINIIKCSKIKK
ncbi:hypothetical protein [Shewanella sp. YLB-07]|uniref:hypothetical protein n=1 Tax=Shewanella sp. YLB-07 TaxID=2601268 RepID=UPI00128B76A0|nr:hypothetical protein [Shewanella sp. YLB-07]MPY24362.1 hypothetical protein [Shewanella sp. YLB-07]